MNSAVKARAQTVIKASQNGTDLEELRDVIQRQLTPLAEQERLVDDEGVAESPFERWPGQIRFPTTPTGKQYRAVMDAMKRRDGDMDNDLLRMVPNWRVIRAVGEIELEGLDSLDFNDVPSPVLNWAARAVDHYFDDFLAYSG